MNSKFSLTIQNKVFERITNDLIKVIPVPDGVDNVEDAICIINDTAYYILSMYRDGRLDDCVASYVKVYDKFEKK